MLDLQMNGVREYGEQYSVALTTDEKTERLCVVAVNEGGNNSTWVDLEDLLKWIKANKPEIWNAI